MAERKCIDLRATFGERYRCEFEESYFAEKPEFRAEEAAWLTIIPCKWGHIYPHGGNLLAAHTVSTRRRRAFESLDCIDVHRDCEREVTVLFDVAHFDRVAAVMQPKRRYRLSPERRAKLLAASEPYRFQPKSNGAKAGISTLERVGTGQGDLFPVPAIGR